MKHRVVAFIIDYILMGITFGCYLILITSLLVETDADYFSERYRTAFIFGLAIVVICKDVFGGRSIGKKIRKVDIINIETNKRISISTSILRNLPFLFLGPIELVFGSTRKDNRRIGDLLAKTKVIS